MLPWYPLLNVFRHPHSIVPRVFCHISLGFLRSFRAIYGEHEAVNRHVRRPGICCIFCGIFFYPLLYLLWSFAVPFVTLCCIFCDFRKMYLLQYILCGFLLYSLWSCVLCIAYFAHPWLYFAVCRWCFAACCVISFAVIRCQHLLILLQFFLHSDVGFAGNSCCCFLRCCAGFALSFATGWCR